MFQGDYHLGRVFGVEYVPERLGLEVDLFVSANIEINKSEAIKFHFKVI